MTREEKFRQALNAVMKRRKISVSQLAKKMERDKQMVQDWVDGVDMPSNWAVYGLCSVLGVSRDYLGFEL